MGYPGAGLGLWHIVDVNGITKTVDGLQAAEPVEEVGVGEGRGMQMIDANGVTAGGRVSRRKTV